MIEVVATNRFALMGQFFCYNPVTERFVGELLPNPKHIGDDCITLSSPDPFLKYRVILKSDIVSMNGVEYKKPVPTASSWNVKGSKGNEYIVTLSSGHYSCTCTGFTFHKTCKHIKSVAK
jgi:hypothetical protein